MKGGNTIVPSSRESGAAVDLIRSDLRWGLVDTRPVAMGGMVKEDKD